MLSIFAPSILPCALDGFALTSRTSSLKEPFCRAFTGDFMGALTEGGVSVEVGRSKNTAALVASLTKMPGASEVSSSEVSSSVGRAVDDKRNHGLVDLKEIDPSIVVHLIYAREENILGRAIYPCNRCYLLEETAKKLSSAQKELEPYGISIMVWDAYRPLSLERLLGEHLDLDRYDRQIKHPGVHCRGACVDVTLVNDRGVALSMPTKFDHFGDKARRDYFQIDEEVIFHRTLLELVMRRQGFIADPEQWWHFHLDSYEAFPELDLSFEELKKGSHCAEHRADTGRS